MMQGIRSSGSCINSIVDMALFIIIGIIAFIALVAFVVFVVYLIFSDSSQKNGQPSSDGYHHTADGNRTGLNWIFTPGYKRAGIEGERTATRIIRSLMQTGDRLFTNVRIEHDGEKAEMDEVLVNRYGVFIIEVKNWTGRIVGGESDYEWKKYKRTGAGSLYEKTEDNPIGQVRRQSGILGRYLRHYGIRVWVRGYVMLIHNNSPVQSGEVLTSNADIARVIHTPDGEMLDGKTVGEIDRLLSERIRSGESEGAVFRFP